MKTGEMGCQRQWVHKKAGAATGQGAPLVENDVGLEVAFARPNGLSMPSIPHPATSHGSFAPSHGRT
ncbi:hypothetical protein NEUTE2DRAFT_53615 [Neurospora tetrasperma FGSC 2509]|nr:hypothetical protein NEUTE2DRAFT_53615 [Neurospora tetrasperma FGSC 2509]